MFWGAFVLALTLFKIKNFAPTKRVHYRNQMPNANSQIPNPKGQSMLYLPLIELLSRTIGPLMSAARLSMAAKAASPGINEESQELD